MARRHKAEPVDVPMFVPFCASGPLEVALPIPEVAVAARHLVDADVVPR